MEKGAMNEDPDVDELEEVVAIIKKEMAARALELEQVERKLEAKRKGSSPDPRIKRIEEALVSLKKQADEVAARLEEVDMALGDMREDSDEESLQNIENTLAALTRGTETAAIRLDQVNNVLARGRDDPGVSRLEESIAELKDETRSLSGKMDAMIVSRTGEELEQRLRAVEEDLGKIQQEIDTKLDSATEKVGTDSLLDRVDEDLEALKRLVVVRLDEVEKQITDLRPSVEGGSQAYRVERIEAELASHKEDTARKLEELAHMLMTLPESVHDGLESRMTALEEETARKLNEVDREPSSELEERIRRLEDDFKSLRDETQQEPPPQVDLEGFREEMAQAMETLARRLLDEWSVDRDSRLDRIDADICKIKDDTAGRLDEVDRKLVRLKDLLGTGYPIRSVKFVDTSNTDIQPPESVESPGKGIDEGVQVGGPSAAEREAEEQEKTSEDGDVTEVEEVRMSQTTVKTPPKAGGRRGSKGKPAKEDGDSTTYIIDDVTQRQLTLARELKRPDLFHDIVVNSSGTVVVGKESSELDKALAQVRATIAATERKLEETEEMRDRTIAYLKRLDRTLISASEYDWLVKHGLDHPALVPKESDKKNKNYVSPGSKTRGSVANGRMEPPLKTWK
ncbi:hypothetical protein AAG570_005695 [Ranatra chinensis]|uniref:Uncharacterized protein n=1 Tax=Ranatra chinensis TaxID=642074 RepID=A0ABD0Y0R5_9HEMI